MSDYTKEKWEIGNSSPDEIIIVAGKNREYICSVQIKQIGGGAIAEVMEDGRQANARRICQCVNNFDQMTANGQRLAKRLQETREQHNKLLDLLRQTSLYIRRLDPLQAKINYAIAEAEKEN